MRQPRNQQQQQRHQQHHHQMPQPPPPRPPATSEAAGAAAVNLNLGDDFDSNDEDGCAAGGQCQHHHGHSHGAGGNPELPTQRQVSLMGIANQLLPLVPCLLLAVLKLLQVHSPGLTLFCGLYATYFFANARLVAASALARREARLAASRLGMAWLAVAMATTVAGVLYYYRDIALWRCLYCLPPLTPGPMDLWTLVFVLTVTDLLLKLGLIAVKAVVVMATSAGSSPSRLGRCRALILLERLYHLYRLLPPLLPWLSLLLEGFSESRFYCLLLVALYAVCKLWHAWRVVSVSLAPLRLALFSRDLGVIGGRGQLPPGAEWCPLCQEGSPDRPIRLACCAHVFCEDCALRWLLRARVCPLCRLGFATLPAGGGDADLLRHMDGETCMGLQLY